MFGVDSSAPEEHAGGDNVSAGGGKAKWLALAAAVILCAGGFAGWTLLKPSAGAAVKDKTGATATGISQPAATPASGPGAASAQASAAPETAQPGAPVTTAPQAAPPAEAAPATGSVQLVSPLVVAVSEKGEALGTSAAPVAMAAGRHILDVTNDEVGYRATQVVDVRPGRTTRIQLALPRGAINVNATPWAEVFVDGQRLGETPLGNVQLTVGSHEVRFRHPQLGEQVRTVLVTTGSSGRLSVDMKQ